MKERPPRGRDWPRAPILVLRERAKLLIVVVPPQAAPDGRLDEIAAAYRTRFDQRAVFRVDRPVCAAL